MSPGAAAAAPITRLDLDASAQALAILHDAACGGSAADWEAVRALDDPADGAVRSVGAATDSCLLLPAGAAAHGLLSALVTPEEGIVGAVVRYRGPGDYIRLQLDMSSKEAVVAQIAGGVQQSLGSAAIPHLTAGRHRLVGTFDARSIEIFLDGELVLRTDSPSSATGRVGLFAARDGLIEFDDIAFVPIIDQQAPRLDPLAPGRTVVGARFDTRLRCLDQECQFSARHEDLPPGLTLERGGRLSGQATRPGLYTFTAAAHPKSGAASRNVPFTLRVGAVSWPRFPNDVASRANRILAVLYTPDDIGPTITMEKLGYPGKILFRLHHDHPSLKVTLMGCPANRYVESAGAIRASTEAGKVWKALALDPDFDWVDLGGHGYSHSPDGDSNLDHHEFSTTQTGCNVEHARLGSAEYCRRHLALSRNAFRDLGIADDLVAVMRFPGMADSPEALRAAADMGFQAILGSRNTMEAGREWWVPHPGGEILEIENSTMRLAFGRSETLEQDLAAGRITQDGLRSDPRFTASVRRGIEYAEQIASQGGILSLFDHYWETFEEFGGVAPRYLVMHKVLEEIESRYQRSVWYPTARDLAVWLDARRLTRVEWRQVDQGLMLTLSPPPAWKRFGLSGVGQATLTARLPVGFTGVSGVELKPEGETFGPLSAAAWWVVPGGIVLNFPYRGGLQLLIRPQELPGHG